MTRLRGGAAVGIVHASSPFASLEATPTLLRIRVLGVGVYEFRPEDVIALEPHPGGWFRSASLDIRHVVAKYPASICFLAAAPSDSLDAIRSAGFVPAAPPQSALPRRPVPFRWTTVILGITLWTALPLILDPRFYLNFWSNSPSPPPPRDPTIGIALFLAAAFFWGIRLGLLRRIILKPGRDFEEIKHWVNMSCALTTLMLPMFALATRLQSRG